MKNAKLNVLVLIRILSSGDSESELKSKLENQNCNLFCINLGGNILHVAVDQGNYRSLKLKQYTWDLLHCQYYHTVSYVCISRSESIMQLASTYCENQLRIRAVFKSTI